MKQMKIFLCGYSDPPQTRHQMQLANSTITTSPKEQTQGRHPTSDYPPLSKGGSPKTEALISCCPQPSFAHRFQHRALLALPTASTSALLTWMPLLAFLSTWCLMQGPSKQSWVIPTLLTLFQLCDVWITDYSAAVFPHQLGEDISTSILHLLLHFNKPSPR